MKGDPGVRAHPAPDSAGAPRPCPPSPGGGGGGTEGFGRREAVSFACGGSSVCFSLSLTEGEAERRESECSFSATQN